MEEELEIYSETLRNAASLYHLDANNRSSVSPFFSESPCLQSIFQGYHLPILHYCVTYLVATFVWVNYALLLTLTYLYVDTQH